MYKIRLTIYELNIGEQIAKGTAQSRKTDQNVFVI